MPRIHGFVLLVPGPPPFLGMVRRALWVGCLRVLVFWFSFGGLVFSRSGVVFLLLFRGVFLMGCASAEDFGALYTGWLSLTVVSTHSTGLMSGRVRGF